MIEKLNCYQSAIIHANILPYSNSNVNPMFFQSGGLGFALRSVFLVILVYN